jgi:hypothetical protein
MNVPSRTVVILISVLAGLLLAGTILWRYESRGRQYRTANGHFEQKYRSSVNDLRLAQEAINACFQKNDAILDGVKKPVPVIVKETAVPAAAGTHNPVILQGISWGDHPVAMIGGKVYQTGDRIQDFTLEEIRIRSIVLRGSNGAGTVIKLMEANP